MKTYKHGRNLMIKALGDFISN